MPLYDIKPLQAAITAASFAQPFVPAETTSYRQAGYFYMQHNSMELTVYVRRKKDYPHSLYLYMGRGDNTRQGSGLGTAFIHEVFNIADRAGVEHVTTRSTEIGRYANAANYTQCNRLHWAALQDELLEALDVYHDQVPHAQRAAAGQQVKLAEAAILAADGALGPLVDLLRPLPNLGLNTSRLPTLAKQLFLGPDETQGYESYWDEAGRMQARRARPAYNRRLAAPFVG